MPTNETERDWSEAVDRGDYQAAENYAQEEADRRERDEGYNRVYGRYGLLGDSLNTLENPAIA